jgi:superfamily I DNA/RNA helicase
MAFSFPLDHQQEKAVYQNGHCLITACPGSGKTRVLSCRATHILSQADTRVVAVTFTRDSAAELKERIFGLCDFDPSKRLFTGTFHSIALSQFRRARMPIRLLSGNEQYIVQRRAWDKVRNHLSQDITFEDAQKWLDAIKSSMEVPGTQNSGMGEFYKAYQDSLRATGAYDFSDLLIQSVILMRNKQLPHLPATHMLVDESQDMDEVQYAWIEHHAKQGIEVSIVGDDDQSIYGFRNAMGYEGMIKFKKQFQAHHINLATNYRSVPEVIYHAKRLIQINTNRVDKPITAHKTITGVVRAVSVLDESDEASEVCKAIKADGSPENWVILCRTNRGLDLVETEMSANRIPCKRIGGQHFWEKREAAIYLGLLKSLITDDGVGELMALHWAGVPKHILDGVDNGEKNWESISNVIATLPDDKMDKAGKRIISGLLERRKGWKKAIQVDRLRLVISGVADWCKAQPTDENNPKHMIFTWCESALNKLSGSLGSRIYALTHPLEKKEGPAAVLMTIHNSKGLEFQNVWIVGASEGLLPHIDSTVEEERRLAYVAMTRAQENLYISYYDGETKRSRFIEEAGL